VIKIIHLKNDVLIVFTAKGLRICYLNDLVTHFDSKIGNKLNFRQAMFTMDLEAPTNYYQISNGITAVTSFGLSVAYADATGSVMIH
jgi:hypothetical protein